jgi:hypothetical protein
MTNVIVAFSNLANALKVTVATHVHCGVVPGRRRIRACVIQYTSSHKRAHTQQSSYVGTVRCGTYFGCSYDNC